MSLSWSVTCSREEEVIKEIPKADVNDVKSHQKKDKVKHTAYYFLSKFKMLITDDYGNLFFFFINLSIEFFR